MNLFVDHSKIVRFACLRRGIWGASDIWYVVPSAAHLVRARPQHTVPTGTQGTAEVLISVSKKFSRCCSKPIC